MTRAGWHWPVALVGLLAAGVIFDVAFLVVAARDPSFAVERDYYRKALDWDRTMAQDARNAELGWQAAAVLSPAPAPVGHSRLAVTVVDRAGKPVERAAVAAELFHNARSARVLEAALAGEPGGRYAGLVPAARPGLWEVRITVTRADAVFTRRLQVELSAAP
jgi:nitrogen fixation protein FixH